MGKKFNPLWGSRKEKKEKAKKKVGMSDVWKVRKEHTPKKKSSGFKFY